MRTLQFYFDYECPYCKKGYDYLMKQIDDYPETEIQWIPIESHPLPENHPPHTHLACQSYYIAKELGADMKAFHDVMYQAVAMERRNVEKPEVLCEIIKSIMDPVKFRVILESGKYAKQIEDNNDLAYEKNNVWYVPALRMDGRKLDAQGGLGINPRELQQFLRG